MTKIAPPVEALARAMCTALKIDPDATFPHGYGYSPYPRIDRGDGSTSVPAVLLHSKNWTRFAWEAQLWMYQKSGGELPEPV